MTQAIRKHAQTTENKPQIKFLIDNVGGLGCTRRARIATMKWFSSSSAVGATYVSPVGEGRETNAPWEGRGFSAAVKLSRSEYHSRRVSREPLSLAGLKAAATKANSYGRVNSVGFGIGILGMFCELRRCGMLWPFSHLFHPYRR